MGGVVDSVFDAVGDVVDSVVDVVEDVVDGVGDVLGDIGEVALDVVTSPVGQIAMYAIPGLNAYAPYINASAKLASGQDLSLTDIAALGFAGYRDINTANWVDPDVALKVKTAAAIADGADPAQVLLSNYGSNWVNEMGITDTFNEGLANIFDADTNAFIQENIDFDQVTRDLVTGASTERMLANQFGQTVVDNLAADDPNLQALGKAGITSAVAMAEGASPESALLAGGKTYYKQGGDLPNFGDLAGELNLDIGDINMPDLGLGFLEDIGKDIYSGIKEFGLADVNLNLGIDLPSMDVDWGQFKLADFGDLTLPQMQNLGVNINQLSDAGNIPMALALAGTEDQQPTIQIGSDDGTDYGADLLKKDYFKNDLLDSGTPLSRKVLGTRYA